MASSVGQAATRRPEAAGRAEPGRSGATPGRQRGETRGRATNAVGRLRESERAWTSRGAAVRSRRAGQVCCMTAVVPPNWRLTCSRAQRAVSMVRGWNSRFVRVSLMRAVTQSCRKTSTSWPLGYASARSLPTLLATGRLEHLTQTYPITPIEARIRASLRLRSFATMLRSSKMDCT